jgi:hypothetical protein
MAEDIFDKTFDAAIMTRVRQLVEDPAVITGSLRATGIEGFGKILQLWDENYARTMQYLADNDQLGPIEALNEGRFTELVHRTEKAMNDLGPDPTPSGEWWKMRAGNMLGQNALRLSECFLSLSHAPELFPRPDDEVAREKLASEEIDASHAALAAWREGCSLPS